MPPRHPLSKSSAIALVAMAVTTNAHSHSGGTPGVLTAWLHPLTGADHLVAMVAVGAWSALLGERAKWSVPGAFLAFMLAGGVVGLRLVDIPAVEIGVALSVLLLGLAVALTERLPVPMAAAAVGAFGFCHGYLHGYELTVVARPVLATVGFMTTTAALHVVGLVMAQSALRCEAGLRVLLGSGWIAAGFGGWLLAVRISA